MPTALQINKIHRSLSVRSDESVVINVHLTAFTEGGTDKIGIRSPI